MNTNSNNHQSASTGMHSANQTGVKPSTFLGTVALSVALLGVAAGWLGHKPPVVVQGEIENSNIKSVPEDAGNVQARHVRQGDKVKKVQLQVLLENQDVQTRPWQECGISSTEPKKILRDSCAEAICVQSNWWVKAKAIAELAQQTVDRSREFQAAGVMSLEELQARERDLDLARGSERAAKANFDVSVALYGEVERLTAAAEHAAQRIAELEALVTELSLVSSIDGDVERPVVEASESVTPGSPVTSIADLKDLWVRFNVSEDLVGDIRVGSTLRVRVPSLGDREVVVKVNYIALNGGLAGSEDPKKTGHFAQKTYEVHAVPVKASAGLRPGMNVLTDWEKFK